MPHFTAISRNERGKYLQLVQQTLLTRFVNSEHRDVKWRNIGVHRKQNLSEVVIVFDLAELFEVSNQDWVPAAMAKLATSI
jgi:hypothetical protein